MAVLLILVIVVAVLPNCLALSGYYCDCSPSYSTCLDLSGVGLEFPVFGQMVDFFEVSLTTYIMK